MMCKETLQLANRDYEGKTNLFCTMLLVTFQVMVLLFSTTFSSKGQDSKLLSWERKKPRPSVLLHFPYFLLNELLVLGVVILNLASTSKFHGTKSNKNGMVFVTFCCFSFFMLSRANLIFLDLQSSANNNVLPSS